MEGNISIVRDTAMLVTQNFQENTQIDSEFVRDTIII